MPPSPRFSFSHGVEVGESERDLVAKLVTPLQRIENNRLISARWAFPQTDKLFIFSRKLDAWNS
jgi:hypothetical protein